MEISGADYQIMNNHTLEDVLGTQQQQQQQQQQQEKKPRPQQETALKCPRCESTNTKFCYYNNYSLSQPRYFCKGCRRYWTKGGSLRNVPVGGGCRKNKRSSNSSSKRAQDLPLNNTLIPPPPPPPPFSSFDPNDLTLAFARLHNRPTLDDHVHDCFLLGNNPNPNPSSSLSPSYMTTTTPYTNTGLLDALRNGFLETTTTTSTPNGLRSALYYGFGSHNNGDCLGGGVGLDGALLGTNSVTTTAATITTTTASQDSCEAIDGGESKALLGLQWQFGGLDAGRDCWNINGVGSSWHDGLINTSLL